MSHTVEKIGGTSMSRFGDIMKNIIVGDGNPENLRNRIFVVSAYGGVTDALLENKKTGAPGVYADFAAGNPEWKKKLEALRVRIHELNRSFEKIGLDVKKADDFIDERLDGTRSCFQHLATLRSFGHFSGRDYLPSAREILSSIGEAHSAFNSSLILQANGINARFVDLTGWMDEFSGTMDEMIRRAFAEIDISSCLPVATGYAKCAGGIMTKFDRGYSEITFSRIAVVTGAREGIIHKEFHLSTGDPKLIGVDKVRTIGFTNFDIADQLSDMAMEAIHPKAAKAMEMADIPIRVTNAFDPGNPGTLIRREYVSPEPRVEMICGRSDVAAIEVFDPEMVGQVGYDYNLMDAFCQCGVSYIAKNTNANTITHYVPERSGKLKECVELIRSRHPHASIKVSKVAIVSVIGSNMRIPGFLSKAAEALARAGINILALDQCMRQVNMQFILSREDFKNAQIALHRALVENI